MQAKSSTQKTAAWVNVFLITAMFSLLQTPPAVATARPVQQEDSQPLFLVLPMPDHESFQELPTAADPLQAEEMARSLIWRQAEPLLNELRELESRGLIESYTLQPENYGVAVTGVTEEARMEFMRSSNIAYTTSSGQSAPFCAVKAAEAFKNLLMIDNRRIENAAQTQFERNIIQNNRLQVNIDPFSDYSWIDGVMPANQLIRFDLIRNGVVVYTENGDSRSDGSFSFYPQWVSCPQMGYNFSIKPGDTVRMTAGSVVKSIDVVELQGFANPVTNTITGKTVGQRAVKAAYLVTNPNDCGGSEYVDSAASDADGNFTINASKDFSALGFVDLRLADGNGNEIVAPAIQYHLYASPAPTSNINLYLPPNIQFTASHRRSGIELETKTGSTAINGWGIALFDQIVEPGDVVEVTGGGVTLSMTAVSINHMIDINMNTISGTAVPNKRVQFEGTNSINNNFAPGSCGGYEGFCGVVNTGASGAFNINVGYDMQPGQEYLLYAYDQHGNMISQHYNVPAIGYDINANKVHILWGARPDIVYFEHRDKSGTVLEARFLMVNPYWGDTWLTLARAAVPEDTIHVSSTDGQMRSVTVPSLSVRLKSGTGAITGTAPNAGKFVAEVRDYNPATGSTTNRCQEQNVSGNFTVAYSGQNWGGQDYVYYTLRDPNGNFFTGMAYAFQVYVWKDLSIVRGYTESPKVTVNVKHTQAGVASAIKSTTSDITGYFEVVTAKSIREGDTVEVSTADGNAYSLLIPKLTLLLDPAGNRIYGQAPASSQMRTIIYRKYNLSGDIASYTLSTRADSAGNYTVSPTGLIWTQNCSSVKVGDNCFYASLRHFLPSGHGVFLVGNHPIPVSEDNYEYDDLWRYATTYNGPQFHTFDEGIDVDWITFTLDSEMIAEKGYAEVALTASNMGWFMGLKGQLYRKDGDDSLTPVGSSFDFSANRPKHTLNVTEPGTYYLEFKPIQGQNYASYGLCDSSYNFSMLVVNDVLYAPVISR